MGMMDTVMSLDQLVDESDPDVDFPNSFHAFQTAEGIRQAHPDKGTITGRKTEIDTETVYKNIQYDIPILNICIHFTFQTGSSW